MSITRFAHRTGAVIAVTAALGMALAGCGSAGANGGGSEANGVVTVNDIEPAAGLVPSNTNDTAGWKVVTQVFEGLVTFGEGGKLVYADAQSITPNADASQYTIKLRPNLRFSDGERIDAQTFARSWSFAANAANGQMGAAILSGIQGYDAIQDPHGNKDAQLTGLKAVDANTLSVTLNAPDSSFPYKVGDVAFLPLPAKAYKDIKAFGEHPVGDGPYELTDWQHDEQIDLKPNPKYNGPRKPKNKGITYKIYTNLDSAYADLESGNLDVLDTIPNTALKTYMKEGGIHGINVPGPGFKSFTIPQSLKHFSGEEGRLRRQAISMAVDRRTIVNRTLNGTATVATDFTAPTITGYSKDLNGDKVLGYNPKEAKELWDKADVISPWSGKFQLAYSADTTNKPWVDAIVNSLRNVLKIDAKPYIFPTAKQLSGAIHDRTIGAAFIQGMQSDYPHPEGYLVQAYDSAGADGKGLNNGDYKSQAFDSLIAQAAKQTDPNTALGIYRQAQEQLLNDLPVIPLWYTNTNMATRQGMSGTTPTYMGTPDYPNLKK